MKKLNTKITLWLACLLAVSGAVTALSLKEKDFKPAFAMSYSNTYTVDSVIGVFDDGLHGLPTGWWKTTNNHNGTMTVYDMPAISPTGAKATDGKYKDQELKYYVYIQDYRDDQHKGDTAAWLKAEGNNRRSTPSPVTGSGMRIPYEIYDGVYSGSGDWVFTIPDNAEAFYFFIGAYNSAGQKLGDYSVAGIYAMERVNAPQKRSFNANGGSGVPATNWYTSSDAFPSTQPTRTGYTFDGWYTDASGGTKITTSAQLAQYWLSDGVRMPETLYAHWKANSYSVTLDRQSGTTGSTAITPTFDSAMPSATMPTRTGYTFNGYWSGKNATGTKYYNANGSSARTWNIANAATLYASWTANKYTVKYNANKPSAATSNVTGVPGDQTWTYDVNGTLGKAPSLIGWTFGGWYKEAACTNRVGNAGATTKNIAASGTVTLYAKWTANKYTVNYNGNKPIKAPSSYNVGNIPASSQWTYDASSTLGSAPTLTGYVFDGWYKEAACTNKVGNAGAALSKINLTPTSGGTVTLYAKWKFNSDVQYVVDLVNNLRKSEYDALTGDIEAAEDAFNALNPEFQPVIESEGYIDILNKAKAVDAVGDTVDALGQAYDTDDWRAKVQAARAEYNALTDTNFKAIGHINTILGDDEGAVVVMDLINEIEDPHWTSASKTLIDNAQNGYNSYITDGHPSGQIANYDTLVYANECYDNVQTFVNKENAISFVYSEGCKTLIDNARNYYEDTLDNYQKSLATSDASAYYNRLVNYENAWHTSYLIDQINEMENVPECGIKIKTAREAVDALNVETELPLMSEVLLKELNDKEAAWGVMTLINKVNPLVYNIQCENYLKEVRNAFTDLEDDQEQYVVNIDILIKAETDYAAVKAVVKEVDVLGAIRHDEESSNKIKHARASYEALTADQKSFYPAYSLQTIIDYETAYVALDKIYNIGLVRYTYECEEAIKDARDFYNSLNKEQNNLINVEDYKVLTDAEYVYTTHHQSVMIMTISLIVAASLLIIGAVWFLFFLLKRRKDDDDDDENNGKTKQNKKKGGVKTMSITGILPIILTSHYLDSPLLALYVLAALAVLLWITVLIVVIVKKAKAKKELEASNEEDSTTYTDEAGNVFQIRFIKSFTAKLIQSPEETKKYYEELKNEALSYKKTNSRVSWHHDAINVGREYVLKFAIRGKTLCVYLPLNADDYLDTKYKVEKSESKRYEDVPCLYRIKNDRRVGYAKELIAVVASNLGLEKGEEQHEIYSDLPYEPNRPLVERGLIKEQKFLISKPQEVVLDTGHDEDDSELITTQDNLGHQYIARYIKSFLAKLIQSEDEVKGYYQELKNFALSYEGTTSRVSWNYDSINLGKTQFVKFGVRGKTLCLYLPLNTEELDEKYKVEKIESLKYEKVPCMYRITNERRLRYAKTLIRKASALLKIKLGEEKNEEYSYPYEDKETLIAKGLIRVTKIKEGNFQEEVLDVKEDEEGDVIITTKDSEGHIYETRYVKSFTARLIQADDEAKDCYSELKNYALSYQDTSARLSWLYDSINLGIESLLKFNIKRNTLCIYYALDVDKLGEKYKVEKVDAKKYSKVPCLYRINARRINYAKELIDRVMKKHKLVKGDEPNEDYYLPYEEKESLVKKGYIRESKILVK